MVNSQGAKLTTFNGEIITTVYGKEMQLETLGNARQETWSFNSQKNIIYKGLASVKILKIKVWDVFNNSSEKEIRFVVKDDFRIETVSSHPNPMQGETRFVFTHNQPDETFDVELEVIQSPGSRIDLVKDKFGSQGIESLPLEWIPSERQVELKPGVYIYRISSTTKDCKKSSGSGRLVFNYR